MESQPGGRKFRRFKIVGTRASNVITQICTTASFGLKMRIEKVGGNRDGVAVRGNRED